VRRFSREGVVGVSCLEVGVLETSEDAETVTGFFENMKMQSSYPDPAVLLPTEE
jgi:hypothetical protein